MTTKDLMKERNLLHNHFKSLMPELAKNFDNLMELTFKDGALPAKTKELIALGISVTVRCEPCMHYHIDKAMEKGATKEEILEAMNVGMEMGIGQVIPPLRKVLFNKFNNEES